MLRREADLGGRDVALEAMRGLAALSVALWHSILAFAPSLAGTLPEFKGQPSLVGTPIYGLVNGSAAVALFFVLSGYVLTKKAIRSSDPRILARNAVKRWPRLAGPAAAATLLAWAGSVAGIFDHEVAGAMSGSSWLRTFAGAGAKPLDAGFMDALGQGLFGTFFRGDFWWDSSLWTMKFEFLGSFAAFGLAAVLIATEGKGHRWMLVGIAVLLASIVGGRWHACFPVGVGLALLPPGKLVSYSGAAALIIVALWLFGFTGDATGIQWPLACAFARLPAVHVWTLGAVCAIVACSGHAPHPSGLFHRAGCFLGRISFPLYLIHVLVLCSLGARVYLGLAAGAMASWAPAAAGAATVAASVLAAVPLAWLNDAWNRGVERWMFGALTGKAA